MYGSYRRTVVKDALDEKLCASTAPSLASPNIISEAAWPLPAMAERRSFSDSPSVVSKMPSSAAAGSVPLVLLAS